MSKTIRVTVWNEFSHEKTEEEVKALFPDGIHETIRSFLSEAGYDVKTATLDMPEHGLTDEVLNNTDVLIWWGHMLHHMVSDEIVEKVAYRVMNCGMGLICLHSAHKSKVFRRIVGTTGNLLWGDNQKEIMWNVLPSHPICEGIPEHFTLDCEEMYGEPFMIPQPDELLFMSWFKHGNVLRSGCTFYRGLGKVFYFQPGHETCKSYFNEHVRKIIINAVKWAAPSDFSVTYPNETIHYKEYLD